MPQRQNSYSYSLNNPLNHIDPDGEYALTGDVGTGTPLDFVFKSYVTGVIIFGKFLGDKVNDAIDSYNNSNSSSVTGGPSPGGNGKKPKKDKKSLNWQKGDKVTTPDTNKTNFLKSKINGGPNNGNGFINKNTGDMWFKSNTSHRGDVWKVFEKGTKNFTKEAGKRKSVKKDGTVVGN